MRHNRSEEFERMEAYALEVQEKAKLYKSKYEEQVKQHGENDLQALNYYSVWQTWQLQADKYAKYL